VKGECSREVKGKTTSEYNIKTLPNVLKLFNRTQCKKIHVIYLEQVYISNLHQYQIVHAGPSLQHKNKNLYFQSIMNLSTVISDALYWQNNNELWLSLNIHI
jgi:hypothetical protein